MGNDKSRDKGESRKGNPDLYINLPDDLHFMQTDFYFLASSLLRAMYIIVIVRIITFLCEAAKLSSPLNPLAESYMSPLSVNKALAVCHYILNCRGIGEVKIV
jgi:hypothetical protein